MDTAERRINVRIKRAKIFFFSFITKCPQMAKYDKKSIAYSLENTIDYVRLFFQQNLTFVER